MNPTTTNAGDKGVDPPKKGEKFRCAGCDMALEITTKEDEHVHFHCCGREMSKV